MKLVVDAETDKVLGASMCGPDAPEIMQVSYLFHHIVLFRNLYTLYFPFTTSLFWSNLVFFILTILFCFRIMADI